MLSRALIFLVSLRKAMEKWPNYPKHGPNVHDSEPRGNRGTAQPRAYDSNHKRQKAPGGYIIERSANERQSAHPAAMDLAIRQDSRENGKGSNGHRYAKEKFECREWHI